LADVCFDGALAALAFAFAFPLAFALALALAATGSSLLVGLMLEFEELDTIDELDPDRASGPMEVNELARGGTIFWSEQL